MIVVLVLGAGGIVGQHMLISKPDHLDAVFCRRTRDRLYSDVDITNGPEILRLLSVWLEPDVVVNLAGESRVDVVEQDPTAYEAVNVRAPLLLSAWCKANDSHFVQASSQAVFSGKNAPYRPTDRTDPITAYGRQKARADEAVLAAGGTVARLTFVVGARPFPGIGRANPTEELFARPTQVQVDDRWFSPLFARDAAAELWRLCDERPGGVVHLGTPVKVSRYDLATWDPFPIVLHARSVQPVSHDYFEGLAERPVDTTWAEGRHTSSFADGMLQAFYDWSAVTTMNTPYRAREIALFLGDPGDSDTEMTATAAAERLALGFVPLHHAVAADFRAANPQSDDELLEWYRTTEAYIWELSAYHLDEGFNYSGMCHGIAEHLWNAGTRRVLCLGDGIGDLTMVLRSRGMQPTYHDLAGSRTAAFAGFRYNLRFGEAIPAALTSTWEPDFGGTYEAVIALDFFEHLTDVEGWARATVTALEPGGVALFQNAFAIGSGEDGSIPMHLASTDRFEHDWDPLLESLGMKREPGGWWRKA